MAYLLLQRSPSTIYGTYGTLYLCDDSGYQAPLCHTLEPSRIDNTSGNGVFFGTYSLCLTYSPKFSRVLPLLDVKGRIGIRIHAGNSIDDTSGCILVGIVCTGKKLLYSKLALQHVLNVIRDCKISQLQIIP